MNIISLLTDAAPEDGNAAEPSGPCNMQVLRPDTETGVGQTPVDERRRRNGLRIVGAD